MTEQLGAALLLLGYMTGILIAWKLDHGTPAFQRIVMAFAFGSLLGLGICVMGTCVLFLLSTALGYKL